MSARPFRFPEKPGAGIGTGLFLLPALSLILSPFKTMAATAPLLLIMDIMAVGCRWSRWVAPVPTVMTGLSAVGGLCGIMAVPHLPSTALKILICIIGVTYAPSNLLSLKGLQKLSSHMSDSFTATALPAYLAPFPGGLFSVVNTGSVFYAFSIAHLKLEDRVFAASYFVLLLLSNFVRGVGFYLNGILPPELIITALKLLPDIAIFSWIGSRIVTHCPPVLVRNLIFLLVLAMCAKTLTSTFRGKRDPHAEGRGFIPGAGQSRLILKRCTRCDWPKHVASALLCRVRRLRLRWHMSFSARHPAPLFSNSVTEILILRDGSQRRLKLSRIFVMCPTKQAPAKESTSA